MGSYVEVAYWLALHLTSKTQFPSLLMCAGFLFKHFENSDIPSLHYLPNIQLKHFQTYYRQLYSASVCAYLAVH